MLSRRSPYRQLQARTINADLGRGKWDADFIELFTDAYASSAPVGFQGLDIAQRKDSPSAHGFASLYRRSQKLTTHAHQVVERFEMASLKTSSIDTSALLANEWEREDERVAELLAIGKAVGLDKYQSSLAAGKPTEPDGDAARFAELLYGGTEKNPSAGWGRVAKKHEKAARKLVKTFSVEVAV